MPSNKLYCDYYRLYCKSIYIYDCITENIKREQPSTIHCSLCSRSSFWPPLLENRIAALACINTELCQITVRLTRIGRNSNMAHVYCQFGFWSCGSSEPHLSFSCRKETVNCKKLLCNSNHNHGCKSHKLNKALPILSWNALRNGSSTTLHSGSCQDYRVDHDVL